MGFSTYLVLLAKREHNEGIRRKFGQQHTVIEISGHPRDNIELREVRHNLISTTPSVRLAKGTLNGNKIIEIPIKLPSRYFCNTPVSPEENESLRPNSTKTQPEN